METVEMLIKREILQMDKPFQLSELIKKITKKYSVQVTLILKVLEQLLDIGLVAYDDIKAGDVSYYSKLSTISA